MRGEPARLIFVLGPSLSSPRRGIRRRLGYPARTRGEVAEWLKAAPSEAPTRRRRLEDMRALPARPSSEDASAILRHTRRSGRVAEGGALLRRYGGECLPRGFESLLPRSTVALQRVQSQVAHAPHS